MMVIFTILITALLALSFVALGVFLVKGRFLNLIAGYSRLSEEDKKSESVRRVGKAAGIFLFVVAFLMVASVVTVQLVPSAKVAVCGVLFVIMLAGIVALFMLSGKK